MFDRNSVGAIFIILSLIALGFLLHTFINLDRLKITVTHPRVIVETSLFLVFLLIGMIIKYYK